MNSKAFQLTAAVAALLAAGSFNAEANKVFGKFAIADLSKKMIRNQTVNVDNITGASVTSMALKYAVKKNLEQAGADLSKFQSKIAKAPLNDSYKSEVVIVGGGGAGLAAAASVIEAGGTAVIVEKLGYLGGSTAVSGGGYNRNVKIARASPTVSRNITRTLCAEATTRIIPNSPNAW